jgi:hypothetical protein
MKNVVDIMIEFVDYLIMVVMEVKVEIYCSYQKNNFVDQQILSYNSSRVLIGDYLMKIP